MGQFHCALASHAVRSDALLIYDFSHKGHDMASVKWKKVRATTQSYGRGMDSSSSSAWWGLFFGDIQLVVIRARPRQFMEAAWWETISGTIEKDLRVPSQRTRKALKAAIEKRLDIIELQDQ